METGNPGGDPYEILGVPAGASREEIIRAYRRAAHAAHPDARPADPQAAGRFQALTEAYDLLSDAGRRAEYDRSHSAGMTDLGVISPSLRSAPRPANAWPGPPLWAGPVHIQPPPGQATGQGWHQAPGLAEAAALLDWYLGRIWDWPR
jgi:hypothetical protein